jgi:hypothetical protein
MQSDEESAEVTRAVARAGGWAVADARRFVRTAHHVVDKLVTEDYTVIAPPLMIAFPNDPVFERLLFLLKNEDWTLGPGGFDSTEEEWAAALHLPLDIVERYPIVGDAGIMIRVLDLLGQPHTAAEDYYPALLAWLDAFQYRDGSPRRYRVRPAGREAAFESWLEARLGLLQDFGFTVRLADVDADGVGGRQHRLDNRSIPDLICRFTADCAHGRKDDWLVVENKTTAVGSQAFHQLSRYVDLLPSLSGVVVDGEVRGLLIADGTSVNLRRALRERGLGLLSLSEIGYRDYLVREAREEPVFEASDETIPYPESVDIDSTE